MRFLVLVSIILNTVPDNVPALYFLLEAILKTHF